MKLSSRTFSVRMRGDDAKLLRSELRQLGYTVDAREGFFGAATYQAVLDFQKQHGLETTDVVRQARHKQVLLSTPFIANR